MNNGKKEAWKKQTFKPQQEPIPVQLSNHSWESSSFVVDTLNDLLDQLWFCGSVGKSDALVSQRSQH